MLWPWPDKSGKAWIWLSACGEWLRTDEDDPKTVYTYGKKTGWFGYMDLKRPIVGNRTKVLRRLQNWREFSPQRWADYNEVDGGPSRYGRMSTLYPLPEGFNPKEYSTRKWPEDIEREKFAGRLEEMGLTQEQIDGVIKMLDDLDFFQLAVNSRTTIDETLGAVFGKILKDPDTLPNLMSLVTGER
jgi:hypothetical protein